MCIEFAALDIERVARDHQEVIIIDLELVLCNTIAIDINAVFNVAYHDIVAVVRGGKHDLAIAYQIVFNHNMTFRRSAYIDRSKSGAVYHIIKLLMFTFKIKFKTEFENDFARINLEYFKLLPLAQKYLFSVKTSVQYKFNAAFTPCCPLSVLTAKDRNFKIPVVKPLPVQLSGSDTF